jgi:hypothetical protein
MVPQTSSVQDTKDRLKRGTVEAARRKPHCPDRPDGPVIFADDRPEGDKCRFDVGSCKDNLAISA